MEKLLPILSLVGATALPLTALAGNPWEDLMGPGKPRLWTDPQARFYLDLPIGWKTDVPKGQDSIVYFWRQHPDIGHVAHVQVEMRSVPPGVKIGHFALRIEKELKKGAPGYRVLDKTKRNVSGVRAVQKYFTYRARNNVQAKREVDQVVFIVGERAFIITMETVAGTRGTFAEDFEKMIKRFVGRAPGEETLPMPKKRRRIRSGEMVNPNAIKY